MPNNDKEDQLTYLMVLNWRFIKENKTYPLITGTEFNPFPEKGLTDTKVASKRKHSIQTVLIIQFSVSLK